MRACRPSATSAADPTLPADADPVARDGLVTQETDQPSSGDRPNVRNRSWVQQPVDRLVRGQSTGQGDHGDNEQASEVLGAAVSVGVALGWSAPRQAEGNQEAATNEAVGCRVWGKVTRRAKISDLAVRRLPIRVKATANG